MLRLAFLFFLLAVGAAILGYGGLAGGFSTLAVIAVYVFAALLVLSLLAALFAGGEAGNPGGVFGALVAAGLIGAGVYYWVDNDMSAERVGASLDRGAIDARNTVENAAQTAGDETKGFVERVDHAADEAADGDGE